MGDIPARMGAAFIKEVGPPDQIVWGELPVPEPAADEVLVKTEAVAVNHVDTFVRSGAFPTAMDFPFVIGRDVVGTVVRPAESSDVRPGDMVWSNSLGYDGRQGSFSEYCAVPVDRLYPLPPGVDPVRAVATLHAGATAAIGLFQKAGLNPGETVVVSGAGGAVGSATVQLAAGFGARVIATTGHDLEWCRSSGASAVIDYREPKLYGAIAELAPDGVDVYWDNSGDPNYVDTIPLLAMRGRMIVTAGFRARAPLPVNDLYTRDASLLGFAITNATVPELERAAERVNAGLAEGALTPRIGPRLSLADAAEAHRLMEDSHRRPPGRIVLMP
jgi:2-desacetyl-2-hydroxyethyl bacteriochlorophyllide A dehydrogenase